jgi:hypothetical protein
MYAQNMDHYIKGVNQRSFLQNFGKETAKFKDRNCSNSSSPEKHSHYIGDGGITNKHAT